MSRFRLIIRSIRCHLGLHKYGRISSTQTIVIADPDVKLWDLQCAWCGKKKVEYGF